MVALGDYTRILRQRWRAIVTMLVLGTLAAVAWTALSTPVHQARAQLYVSTVSSRTVTELAQGSSFTQRQVSTYADVVRSPFVLEPVIAELGLAQTPQELAGSVVATVRPDTVLIDISVTDPDPERALALAGAVSDQAVVAISELDGVEDGGPSPVRATVISEAVLRPEPISPQPVRNLALGLLGGLLAGLAVALLRDLTDLRVRGEADVRALTPAPVLGAVPLDGRAAGSPTLVVDEPYHGLSEALRTVRTNLTFVNAGQQPRSLVVTSPVPGEGKTTLSAHLALTLAANGMRVCLVEADLRRPQLAGHLGLDGDAGLTTVLIGRAGLDEVLQPFGTTGVTLLGSGQLPPNPAELLGSPRMRELLEELHGRFDVTVLDAPPLLPVTDAAVVSGLTDGALVVVGARVVRRAELGAALKRLELAQVPLLGLVLNRTAAWTGEGYGDGGYGSASLPHPSRRSRRRWAAGAGGRRARPPAASG